MPDLHENSEELYGSGKRTAGNALRGTRLAIKGASRAVQAAGNAVKAARAGIKAGETVGRILVMILQALGITGIAVLGGLFLCFVIAWVFYVQLAPSASSGMAKTPMTVRCREAGSPLPPAWAPLRSRNRMGIFSLSKIWGLTAGIFGTVRLRNLR